MAKNGETFTTPKGTKLHLIKLKGKNYMNVAQRLIWFEEENPYYDISTQELTPLAGGDGKHNDYVVVKTTVTIFTLNENEQAMIKRKATATKTECKQHFNDFHEKAETGSLGRALAMLGYGTQFAEEDLDEGDRIVDSPVPGNKKEATSAPSEEKVSSFRRSTAKKVTEVEDDSGF